ncbi:MAG: hypothetical protein JNK82_01525 [Myxococcaceae bacterium]|nr:hypothetical protein [Myxococcaceae bacterium]
MTAPVGPTGIAQRCTGRHGPDEELPKARFALNVAAVRTTLLLLGRVQVEQLAVSSVLQLHVGQRGTLSFGGGALLGGTLYAGDGQYHLGPGSTASASYSHLVLEPKGAVPFVQVSGSLATSFAPTRAGSYVGVDLRAGVAVGWLLWSRFSPYATARAFGGPVFWRGELGGDLYHFQLGAGFVLGLPGGFDLYAECVPLGEQSVSAGVGYSF